MAKHMKVGAMVTTGGTILKDDIMRLEAPIHILVGTPGRVHDLADRGIAKLNKCKIIVMDEADKLLSPEFQPGKYQTLRSFIFFSVTVSHFRVRHWYSLSRVGDDISCSCFFGNNLPLSDPIFNF
jgi:superfamily II DNA/RNA helicase